MPAAEMDRVAALEVLRWEGGDRDHLGLELVQRIPQTAEVPGGGEDGEIGVSAKLRCAVEHARLAAHQQGLHAVRTHRGKDSGNRTQAQAGLPAGGTSPTA